MQLDKAHTIGDYDQLSHNAINPQENHKDHPYQTLLSYTAKLLLQKNKTENNDQGIDSPWW